MVDQMRKEKRKRKLVCKLLLEITIAHNSLTCIRGNGCGPTDFHSGEK
jgi:hypothetical protein